MSIQNLIFPAVILFVASQAQGDPLEVSLIQLIANPSAYHGKFIRVDGYFHFKNEDQGLYLSKDDADHLMSRNAIWVSFDGPGKTTQDFKALDCQYVLLEGVFNSKGAGHMDLYSGEIQMVSRGMRLKRFYDGRNVLRP